MKLRRTGQTMVAALLFASVCHAQDSGIPSLPYPTDDDQTRIAPLRPDPRETGILTTKQPIIEPAKPLPWVKQQTAPAVAPSPVPATGNNGLPANMPFARQAPTGPVVPSAPHSTVAVPVGDVDAVEVKEAAPPEPVAAGANPAQEDPAQPTELTSPIFDSNKDDASPRKIIFRVLNKVTAQAALMEAKPGDVVKFGKIDITAQMCRSSVPTSQLDYAGLFDVREHVPGTDQLKALFHGWMYASSPSVSALEHPIYDVTMVECKIAMAAAKPAEKLEKKMKQ